MGDPLADYPRPDLRRLSVVQPSYSFAIEMTQARRGALIGS